jgi:hypothetical protein
MFYTIESAVYFITSLISSPDPQIYHSYTQLMISKEYFSRLKFVLF